MRHVARPAPVPPHSSQLASIMANFQSIWQAGTGWDWFPHIFVADAL